MTDLTPKIKALSYGDRVMWLRLHDGATFHGSFVQVCRGHEKIILVRNAIRELVAIHTDNLLEITTLSHRTKNVPGEILLPIPSNR